MTPVQTPGVALVGWWLAMLVAWGPVVARAAPVPVEYALETPAPGASVKGPGRLISGFRVNPGGTLRFATAGEGALKILYFQEFSKAMPLPEEVRLLVAIDGVGKMFPLKPKVEADYAFPEPRAPTKPSAPMGVILRLPAGEHVLVVKLAPGPKLGGVLSLPEARVKGSGALDDLDFDLPPIAPLGDELTLDLDLGAPGAAPIADLGFDLDLDLPAAPPAATKPVEPVKPPVVASKPVEPVKPPVATKPTEPAKPPVVAAKPTTPAKPPVPLPTPGLVASVEPAKPVAARPPAPPPVDAGPPPELGTLEIGAKAGWALSRGRLEGQGVYLAELGYRLKAQGLPSLRLSLTSGYTLLTGSWSTFTPGYGYGTVLQNSHLVPVEVGATWSFGPFGPVSPYLGAAASLSFAAVEVSAYSLPSRRSSGLAPGVTSVGGVRLQFAPVVLVFEVRHQEGALADRLLARVGEQSLPTTSFLGGLLVAF